jgi:O-methyltransferase
MGLLDKIKWHIRFWRDTRNLSSVSRQVLKERLTYLAIPKFERLENALKETQHLKGDLIEFGIALGGSAIVMAQAAKPDRRFIGFDVFAMIPEPTSDKDDEKSKKRYETIKSGKSSGIDGDTYYGYQEDLYGIVSASFAKYGVPVDGDRIQLIKGLFEDTWPTTDIQSIAIAHLDCDWYDPVKYCLAVCADKMLPGGQIIIDDYHAYGGCRTAVDEFLAERKDYRMEPGRNPILHKL